MMMVEIVRRISCRSLFSYYLVDVLSPALTVTTGNTEGETLKFRSLHAPLVYFNVYPVRFFSHAIVNEVVRILGISRLSL